MENFYRENIDKLLKINQIRNIDQNSDQNFALYGSFDTT